MFKKVLVGVDGSSTGRDAIALARLLTTPKAELVFAHVYELTPLRVVSGVVESVERERSMRLLEEERESTGSDAELIVQPADSVGRGLHYLAGTLDADLLVVGSCRRGFTGRVLVGNDTRASLNGACCAVAVAPLGYSDTQPVWHTIGVGYDGSPESVAALAAARDLAERSHAVVRALQVVQLPIAVGLGGIPWGSALEDLIVGSQQEMAALEGVKGEAVLGLVGEELAAFGEHVDLLVVGSRGYGPMLRLVLGGTAEHLAAHARTPLLVLPRTAVPGAPGQLPARDVPVMTALSALRMPPGAGVGLFATARMGRDA